MTGQGIGLCGGGGGLGYVVRAVVMVMWVGGGGWSIGDRPGHRDVCGGGMVGACG